MENWAVVRSDELLENQRADAEYYINPYNDYLSHLAKNSELEWQPLSAISSRLTSGHTPLRHDLKVGSVEFYTVECVDALALHRSKAKKVTGDQLAGELKRVALRKGDLLITIKRRIGMAAPLLSEPGPAAINQDVVVMTPKPGWSAAVVAAFLVSRPGQYQALRDATEQMNPYLNVQALGKILVPRLPDAERVKIERLVKSRTDALRDSQEKYQAAQDALMAKLGWSAPSKSTSEIFELSAAKLMENGRADAEFFAPSQYELLDALQRGSSRSISTFSAKAERGIQPVTSDGDVVVIDSKAVRELGVAAEKADRTSRAQRNSSLRGRVERNDVLLNSTGVGTLGRATCYRSREPAVCDNHVAIIRPDPSVCRPEYLALFLNSPAGRMQTERFQSGSSGQVELYPDAIGKIDVFIPLDAAGAIDGSWQDSLSEMVIEAADEMNTARDLLSEITASVALAVEQGPYGPKGYEVPVKV